MTHFVVVIGLPCLQNIWKPIILFVSIVAISHRCVMVYCFFGEHSWFPSSSESWLPMLEHFLWVNAPDFAIGLPTPTQIRLLHIKTHRICKLYVSQVVLGTLYVVQFLFLTSWRLIVLAVSGHAYSMTVNKIGLLDLSEVNMMCMEEHSSLYIPYGYRMDDLFIIWYDTLM